MAKSRREYDADNQILWVHWPETKGQSLITRDQLQPYINILLGDEKAEGPVKAVRFVFNDKEAAEYNHHSLKFVRVETWLDDGGKRRSLDGKGDPSFEAREDFGIQES